MPDLRRILHVYDIHFLIACTRLGPPSYRNDGGLSDQLASITRMRRILSRKRTASYFKATICIKSPGVDTDKYKYPIGSGRVTFNNHKSFMRAVNAAFIEVKTAKFTKKIQVNLKSLKHLVNVLAAYLRNDIQ